MSLLATLVALLPILEVLLLLVVLRLPGTRAMPLSCTLGPSLAYCLIAGTITLLLAA